VLGEMTKPLDVSVARRRKVARWFYAKLPPRWGIPREIISVDRHYERLIHKIDKRRNPEVHQEIEYSGQPATIST
jgi:hypothetical protein